MNKNAIKLFNLGGRNHLADSVFVLQGKSYGIYMLKLVGPSECHLLDYVKTNISPKAISMASVTSLFFHWSLGDHQPGI